MKERVGRWRSTGRRSYELRALSSKPIEVHSGVVD